MLQEILDIVKFWLDKGVDGFRVDAVPHMYEDQRFLDHAPSAERPPEALPDEYRYWENTYTYNLPQVLDALAAIRKLCDEYSATDNKTRFGHRHQSIKCIVS